MFYPAGDKLDSFYAQKAHIFRVCTDLNNLKTASTHILERHHSNLVAVLDILIDIFAVRLSLN